MLSHSQEAWRLFESDYEEVMANELDKRGLFIRRQTPIPVVSDDGKLELGFRADIIVEDLVIVEIKLIESIASVHQKQ